MMKGKKEVFTMIIAGLTGYGVDLTQTANLIYTILNSHNKKVSVLDYKNLKDVKTLKSYIQEIRKNCSDFLIIKIDYSKNLEHELLKYIQFDIILHNNGTDPVCEWNIYDYNEIIEKLLPFLSIKGTVILNGDFLIEPLYIRDPELLVITYGFNSRAELTTSSVSDTLFGREFIFYQQKSIRTIDGRYICPQEYRINTDKTNVDVYTILGSVAFSLIGGIHLKFGVPLTTVYSNTGLSEFYSSI